MRTSVKISLITVFFFLFVRLAIESTHGSRMQQLIEAERKLSHSLVYHETHVMGPYTKVLLNEMKAVKVQIGKMRVELGCREQKEQDPMCYILYVQELGLASQIVAQGLNWYDHAQGKVMKGMANSGQQQGGKVVFKKVVREDAGP